MTKQINKRRQTLLLATILAFIVLGASGSVFAQKADKYPKPDFSAMEEYFEVVEYEYDFSSSVPAFIVVAKPKQKVVPTWWEVTWRDAKGVKIVSFTVYFHQVYKVKIGEPVRGEGYAPFKTQMTGVKSVIVTERPDSQEEKTAN
jgi:hypothetical protein